MCVCLGGLDHWMGSNNIDLDVEDLDVEDVVTGTLNCIITRMNESQTCLTGRVGGGVIRNKLSLKITKVGQRAV